MAQLDIHSHIPTGRFERIHLNFSDLYTTKAPLASPTFTGTVNISEAVSITGDISPTQISSNQNNYNPTGLDTATVLRLSTDASRIISGIAGGTDGRALTLLNVGSNNIVLADDSASSSATARFALVSDLIMKPDSGVSLLYDSTSSRWRAITPAHGAWTVYTPTITPSGGAFTSATATGRYQLVGKTVTGNIDLVVTTKGGTATNEFVDLSIPFAPEGSRATHFFGKEWNSTGLPVFAYINFTAQVIRVQGQISSVATYPVGDNYKYTIPFTYEAA